MCDKYIKTKIGYAYLKSSECFSAEEIGLCECLNCLNEFTKDFEATHQYDANCGFFHIWSVENCNITKLIEYADFINMNERLKSIEYKSGEQSVHLYGKSDSKCKHPWCLKNLYNCIKCKQNPMYVCITCKRSTLNEQHLSCFSYLCADCAKGNGAEECQRCGATGEIQPNCKTCDPTPCTKCYNCVSDCCNIDYCYPCL